MGDSPKPDLAVAITALSTKLDALHMIVDELKQDRRVDSPSSGAKTPATGEHHQDRPPRFQKLNFPHYDSKSDPLAFINRRESYFH